MEKRNLKKSTRRMTKTERYLEYKLIYLMMTEIWIMWRIDGIV